MSWVITGSEKTPVDPQFGSVSLLLHGNGANGSTTITDSSPTPKTVTANSGAVISTAQSKFGGASIDFRASGANATAVADSSLVMGSGDFTVEGWIYLTANVTTFLNILVIGGSPDILYVNFRANNNIGLTNQTTVYATGGPVAIETWTHFAAVRASGVATIYVNGIGGTPASAPANFSSVGSTVTIDPSGHFLDDLRITKGVARYTSNFTPPTAPFPDI